ncbi:MAG: hypothetical protein OXG44_15105 [Gammaproteobacteria bacterium]|nr:hypothetical protein [Gammaproteobacteria bacterium]
MFFTEVAEGWHKFWCGTRNESTGHYIGFTCGAMVWVLLVAFVVLLIEVLWRILWMMIAS